MQPPNLSSLVFDASRQPSWPAHGAGRNADYVLNTTRHLDRIGIGDTCLHRVGRLLVPAE